MDKLKLLFIITSRADEPAISELVSRLGGALTASTFCKGTAKSDLLEVLGISDTEKSLVLATAKESTIKVIYNVLVDVYKFNEQGTGIAFSVPISAVGGPATLKLLSGALGNTIGGK